MSRQRQSEVEGAAGMTLEGFVRAWLERRGFDPGRPLSSKRRKEIEDRLRLLFPASGEPDDPGAEARPPDALYTVHPYGDEWLWAEDGENPKLVRWDLDAIRTVAARHRAGMVRVADEQGRDYLTDMHFVLRRYVPGAADPVSADIAALVTAEDEVLAREDPGFVDAWEAIVNDDTGRSER